MEKRRGVILVVDDNEMNREVLSRRLIRKGYETSLAEHGKQALEMIEENVFDLILLDIMMPVMSGIEVLKVLREQFSPIELPVIMVTAKTHSDDIVEALTLGANDYITKPIDFPVAFARITTQLSLKFTEAALKESEERYALAARGANDGLWDINLKTAEAYYSPRWKEILGYGDTELAGRAEEWFKRVHSDDIGRVRSHYEQHLAGKSANFQNEHRILHADGSYRWVLCRGLVIRDESGHPSRIAGSLSDITQRRLVQQQLQNELIHDVLTGLPNQKSFVDRLDSSLVNARWKRKSLLAVLVLDLDHFKRVNETYGIQKGDMLLGDVADRLQQNIRGSTKLARLSGDDFGILIEQVDSIETAVRFAEGLKRVFDSPFLIDGAPLFISASVGLALCSTNYEAAEDVIRDAETAMQHAKSTGNIELFDPRMRTRSVARFQLATQLRWALEQAEFKLFYRPIIELPAGRIAGLEVELHWNHPELGLQPLDEELLEVAEETRMSERIDSWLLREVCAQLRRWNNELALENPPFVSLNIGGRLFTRPDFVDQLGELLAEFCLDASWLKLELTESELRRDTARSKAMIQRLQEKEMAVVIDGFGSGASSLSCLLDFPVGTIKLAAALLNRLETGGNTVETMLRHLTLLAEELELLIVANGVQSARHLAILRDLNVRFAQGDLFSEALDPASAATTLSSNQRW